MGHLRFHKVTEGGSPGFRHRAHEFLKWPHQIISFLEGSHGVSSGMTSDVIMGHIPFSNGFPVHLELTRASQGSTSHFLKKREFQRGCMSSPMFS